MSARMPTKLFSAHLRFLLCDICPCSKGLRGTEALRGAGLGLSGLLFAILRWGGGFEGLQKAKRDIRDLVDGGVEGSFVGLGRLIEARDFAHEFAATRHGPLPA